MSDVPEVKEAEPEPEKKNITPEIKDVDDKDDEPEVPPPPPKPPALPTNDQQPTAPPTNQPAGPPT